MSKEIDREMIPISLHDILTFECSSQNACFNDCCRDLNQVLTPYDILRLKKNLGIKSDIFLKRYTSLHNGPESGLPVVTFKSDPCSGYACPFVTDKGCSVYEDRPASCRIYPLARAISKSRDTGEITEYFALIREPHCKGFYRKKKQTAEEWITIQDIDIYNTMNDKLMDIISLKNRRIPGALDKISADKFYLACYDLALLDFGIAYVKNFLFGMDITPVI